MNDKCRVFALNGEELFPCRWAKAKKLVKANVAEKIYVNGESCIKMLEQTRMYKPQEAIMEVSIGRRFNIYLNNNKIGGVIGLQWYENYEGGWLCFSPLSRFNLDSKLETNIKITEVLSNDKEETLYMNEELLDFSVRTNEELQPQICVCFGKQQTFPDEEINTSAETKDKSNETPCTFEVGTYNYLSGPDCVQQTDGAGNLNWVRIKDGKLKEDVEQENKFEFPETLYQFKSSEKAIMVLKLEKVLVGKEKKLGGRYRIRTDHKSNLTDLIIIEQDIVTDDISDGGTIWWPARIKLSAAILDFEQYRSFNIKKLKSELQSLESNTIPNILM